MNRKGFLKRHTPYGMLIHWFNAVCWFYLLATGVGLIRNPALQPLGSWYPNMLHDIFGSGENLLRAHWMVGAGWLGVWLVFIIVGLTRFTLPFLKEITTFQIRRDIHWTIKKNLQMLVGYQGMANLVAPLGWDPTIPDQDYYNAGQKAAALPIIGGALVLAATGILMVLSPRVLGPEWVFLVQWSVTIHYMMAMLTLAVLLIHLFMAGISKDERPAFMSMITGEVTEEYARHHHKIWYERLKGEEK